MFLQGSPHRFGKMKKQKLFTPRKPNSGHRQMLRIYIRKLDRQVWISVPGFRLVKPKLNLNVLFCGGRAKDIPGSRFEIVRHGRKGEVEGDVRHHRRPSIYGVQLKFRQLYSRIFKLFYI